MAQATAAPESTGFDQRQARRAASSSFVGAVVEWYDFLLYGLVAATVFNRQFFAFESASMDLLASFAVLGVGFLFRPLGGLFFGHMGDRLGRKRVLYLTMTVMGVATVLIGLLPTFDVVGWWAPVFLVLLRALQGFAVGGEWGGAALLAVENAPRHRRALYSSGVQVGYAVGLVMATGAVTIMQSVAGDGYETWGWRVPFVAAGVLIAVGLWVRSSVYEEPPAPRDQEEGLPIVAAIRKHPRAFFEIIGLRCVELFSMYIVTTFAVSYASGVLGLERSFMIDIALLVGVLGIFFIPFFAYLSDRIGRRRVYVAASLVAAASAVPFFLTLEAGNAWGVALSAVVLINIGHDAVVSTQQPLITEMFGKEHRNSGASVGYQVAAALAGGFTPFIATWLAEVGGGWHLVAAYLVAGSLVSAAVAAWVTREKSEPEDLESKA